MTLHAPTAAETVAIQDALKAAGFDPGPSDGKFGKRTLAAVHAAQEHFGLPVEDNVTLPLLTELRVFSPASKGLSPMQATIADYVLNFVTSKINWFAAAMVGVIVTWLNTKFGLTLDAGTQAAITTVLVTAMGAGVMLLRTFFNAPKVATKQPDIVKKP